MLFEVKILSFFGPKISLLYRGLSSSDTAVLPRLTPGPLCQTNPTRIQGGEKLVIDRHTDLLKLFGEPCRGVRKKMKISYIARYDTAKVSFPPYNVSTAVATGLDGCFNEVKIEFHLAYTLGRRDTNSRPVLVHSHRKHARRRRNEQN